MGLHRARKPHRPQCAGAAAIDLGHAADHPQVRGERGEDPAAYCDDLPFRADRFKPVVSGGKLKELEVEHG